MSMDEAVNSRQEKGSDAKVVRDEPHLLLWPSRTTDDDDDDEGKDEKGHLSPMTPDPLRDDDIA